MRFGFVGGSYTAKSSNIADEQAVNWYPETNETAGAQARMSYLPTPGLKSFCLLPKSPVRGQLEGNGLMVAVGGDTLYYIKSDGTAVPLGFVGTDGNPVSMAWSSTQVLIVSNGHAYCYTFASGSLDEVTEQLAAIPAQVQYDDSFFVVCFKNSNKFQISDPLDGLTWPGLQVNEVSVFPENITGILANHRELWVMGGQHIQPYQDTGSFEIFDPVPGALMETGLVSTFCRDRADNSTFWIHEDERGGRMAWRANGYVPQRVSTHAIETAFSSYSTMSDAVSYVYQDSGHTFWVIYIPSADTSWVYDIAEGLWHERAEWKGQFYGPHRSWNHAYCFGKHLLGDWKTGNIWETSLDFYDNAGDVLRRARRSPTINNELEWAYFAELKVDFDTGQGPQPPLTDGNGDPRAPQAMLRWSDDGGKTWSNEHWQDCGLAGEYGTFVRWYKLGRGRRRVFELVVSDPVFWAITDAYLRTA